MLCVTSLAAFPLSIQATSTITGCSLACDGHVLGPHESRVNPEQDRGTEAELTSDGCAEPPHGAEMASGMHEILPKRAPWRCRWFVFDHGKA
jgi:hypothetical protein